MTKLFNFSFFGSKKCSYGGYIKPFDIIDKIPEGYDIDR